MKASSLQPNWIACGDRVLFSKAYYYGVECQIAGEAMHFEVLGDDRKMHLRLLGTTADSLLTWGSSQTGPVMRMHLCGDSCNREEVSDALAHGVKVRRIVDPSKEEGWVSNLVPVAPERDELQALRQRGAELEAPPGGLDPAAKAKEKSPSRDKSKKDKKKKKAKSSKKDDKEEKAKKKRKKEEETVSSSEGEQLRRGHRCRAASKKDPKLLYQGTGLDPNERVRRVVAKQAKKYLRRKGRSSSSKSGSSDSSASGSSPDFQEDTVFEQASKVRIVAERFPGALSSQTLSSMRTHLLTEVGTEAQGSSLKGIALPYYRQCLHRRGSAPQQREMMTLASGVEALLSGRIAHATDLLLQRLKSCEASLSGTHWTVAQRLELLAPEGVTATPLPELHQAHRDVYQESKLRHQASYQDGRPSGAKGKQKGDNPPKGSGKDRKPFGKGQGAKGDNSKKKDESGGKT